MVQGKGFVNLSGANGEIKILNVLYVPGLINNLLSTGCIVDKDFVLMFDDTKCLI